MLLPATRRIPRSACLSARPIRPVIRVPPRRVPHAPPGASAAETVDTVSYLVGKSIILFTMFYCTLNWAHYRDLRKRDQDKEE